MLPASVMSLVCLCLWNVPFVHSCSTPHDAGLDGDVLRYWCLSFSGRCSLCCDLFVLPSFWFKPKGQEWTYFVVILLFEATLRLFVMVFLFFFLLILHAFCALLVFALALVLWRFSSYCTSTGFGTVMFNGFTVRSSLFFPVSSGAIAPFFAGRCSRPPCPLCSIFVPGCPPRL